MLLIKTKVKESTIPGANLGLFADQFIKKGTVTLRFCLNYDIIVAKKDLSHFSKQSLDQFLNYCYFDKLTKHFILCGDDDRFINHSYEPNIIQSVEYGEIEGVEVAARDIEKGEELFTNYYDYDEDAQRKFKEVDELQYLKYEENLN